MLKTWTDFWGWLYGNYIYHAFIVIALVCLFIFPGRLGCILGRIFGKFKKIKAGTLELQTGEDIDPNTPCPYKKSRDDSFGAIRKLEGKIDNLAKGFDELKTETHDTREMAKNIIVDQQKQLFYDTNQPDPERLAGGLKYIYYGGDHEVKSDVIIFSEQHKSMYKALILAKPELKIAVNNK